MLLKFQYLVLFFNKNIMNFEIQFFVLYYFKFIFIKKFYQAIIYL